MKYISHPLLLSLSYFIFFSATAQKPASGPSADSLGWSGGISAGGGSGASSVTIRIVDETGKGIDGATVSVKSVPPHAVYAKVLCDKDGVVRFGRLTAGQYTIEAGSIGYLTQTSAPFTLAGDSAMYLPAMRLSKDIQTLQKVQVGAKKPFIERQAGKIVLHVENSITAAGSSAFEILEKAPNVSVDQADNISLRGKAGVLIMIDGKPSRMTGADLANMLRAMPSSAIEDIELITNPNAKYDAAGNAGIINIKLKKNQHMGLNGSINMGLSQGFYAKTNEGFNFNYRHQKINIYGGYNYSYRKSFVNPNLYRVFLQGDSTTGAYRQKDDIIFPFNTNLERLGIDYSASPKTIIGLLFNGTQNRYTWKGDNFSDVFDGNGQLQSTFTTISSSANRYDNYAYNANLRHSFDSANGALTVDLDYARYLSSSYQIFTSDYFNPDGSVSSPEYVLFGSLPGSLNIRSLNADYTRPAGANGKWEAGLKISRVHADNDITFYDSTGNTTVYDSTKSNHFIYQENINAGYINFHNRHKDLDYELGIRIEQTVVKGNQMVSHEQIDTSYLQVFPDLSLTYKLSPSHQVGFSAGRRIERPTYKQLNPFKFYIDPTTYTQGNPLLRPQTTYNFELSHTYKEKLTTTLTYSATRDNITEVLYPSPTENKVTIQTNKNLELVQYYWLNVAYASQLTKWWNTVSDCAIYYGSYKGDLANTSLNNGNLTFNINSNNTFQMGKGYNSELNFFYRAHEVYGFYTLRPVWQLSAGIQKSVLKNKGSVKLNVSDIFFSNVNKGSTSYTDYFESFVTVRDTRIAGISFSYRFGNNKIAPARKRTGGAESEKSRAANNGG